MAEFLCAISAGMIFTEPRVMPLAGREFPVDELLVRNVGSIESAMAERLHHPHADLRGEIYVLRNRHEFSRDEIRDAGLALMADGVAWPPRMGSGIFHRCLNTPEGAAIFLYVVLSRFTPVDPADIRGLLSGAREGELGAISHRAWGYAAWERVEAGRGRTDAEDAADEDDAWAGGRSGGGMKWGRFFSYLARQCGWTYPEMGDMTLGQFLCELNAGADRTMDLADLEPADPRVQRRDYPGGKSRRGDLEV